MSAITPELTAERYAIERAICDTAEAYAARMRATRGPRCAYITREEAAHPDYAACNNEMRGRVEQYELLTSPPEKLSAYVALDGFITTWTGHRIGRILNVGQPWRGRNYYDTIAQYRVALAGRTYTGRSGGAGMLINLRLVKSK